MTKCLLIILILLTFQSCTKQPDVSQKPAEENKPIPEEKEFPFFPSKEFQKNVIWTSGGTDNMVPPRPVGRLSMKYPRMARESGIEASVRVEIFLTEEGKVGHVRTGLITLSPDPGRDKESVLKAVFADAAKKGLMKAQFVPLVVNGERSASHFAHVLQFKLEK